ncbi:hypothetical protein [Shewanella sedimentimangrovi]|uniref:Uncharacterized protein n=1 Tax=Shewanella sedimentimangrovi TaxID=2814293 RepID=A0ABX7QZ13_9GAMM|nr:hypothetical protein [Shewanella sedimentimangrovi]QSX35855.1 hypothetical protein JYB85_10805 [Shewanella sedimentimangrovi]
MNTRFNIPGRLNILLASLLSAGLLLSQASCAAPSQVPDGSQEEKTHVRVVVDGNVTEADFSDDELKDSATIDNKLGALPDEQRQKVGKLLKRMGEGKMPGMDPEFDKRLAALQAEMEERQKVIEFHTKEFEQRVESKARELEERGHEIELLVQAHMPHEVLEWDDEDGMELEIIRGDKQDGRRVFQVRHHDVTEALLDMLKHNKLTEEQKAKLREALN